jgi:hypothetical protein
MNVCKLVLAKFEGMILCSKPNQACFLNLQKQVAKSMKVHLGPHKFYFTELVVVQ